jgi:hypothetical protein
MAAIDHQERIAMGQDRHDLHDIHGHRLGLRRVACAFGHFRRITHSVAQNIIATGCTF